MKNFVYLQSQSQTQRAAYPSVMRSAAGIFYAQRFAYIPAECKPRELSVIGSSALCDGFDAGSGTPLFLCLNVKIPQQ